MYSKHCTCMYMVSKGLRERAPSMYDQFKTTSHFPPLSSGLSAGVMSKTHSGKVWGQGCICLLCLGVKFVDRVAGAERVMLCCCTVNIPCCVDAQGMCCKQAHMYMICVSM